MSPLAGINVLDMSRVLAGPWAGQVLADLGAKVTKVERPGTGDDTRHWGPPYLPDDDGNPTSESAYFMSANRGKSSLSIDITSEQGQAQIRELVRASDVLIENYKVGGLAQYGLDYDALREINPGLVYCSITGFGQTGPYADRAGYDFMIQAMSGLMSITGSADEQGGEPTKVGVAVTDIVTGLYAVIAIQAALLERQQTGLGKHIDMALLDCATALLANQATNYLVGNTVPGRLGNTHPNIVPYQAFPTADGHIIIAVGNDGQFAKLCTLLDRENWANDARYQTNAARVAAREDLVPAISDILTTQTSEQWLTQLNPLGIPCGPINTLDQVFADPQLQFRNMIQPTQHPHRETPVPLVSSPIQFVGEQKINTAAPPLLSTVSRD